MIKTYNDTIKHSLQEINFSKIKKDAKSIENYGYKTLARSFLGFKEQIDKTRYTKRDSNCKTNGKAR